MAYTQIKKYLTCDLTPNEIESYFKYIEGDHSSTDWIEKTSIKRDLILDLQLKCPFLHNGELCDKWININEKGICTCPDGHVCSGYVLESMKSIK